MAGMFYSIQETAEKLGITEDEVKQLAKDGKLREFRDGENIMFKVDEVDNIHDQESALQFDVLDETPVEPMADVDLSPIDEPTADAGDLDLDLEAPLTLEEETADVGEASNDDLDVLMAMTEDVDLPAESEPELELEAAPELEPELESAPELEPVAAEDDDLGLLETDDLSFTEDEPQIDLLSDTQVTADIPATEGTASGFDDISLSEADGTALEPSLDTGLEAGLGDDTAVTGEGISVLGETDADYKLTDDTMAETLAGLGATGEASLEEIEEDVNLDSFGSGSGLLDLSLQADDTSLGGILDEIYTNDDEDAVAPDTEQATSEAMSAEVDQLSVADEMPEAEMGMVPVPMATAAVAEIEPDASSNALGAMLFLPLFLLIFTSIVALYASFTQGSLVSAADAIKGFFWIAMGGLFVVALIWAGVGFSKGSAGGAKAAKPKRGKAKKAKAAKPKKEKKKKEKAPKAKKEKKSLFGKKK